MTQARLAFRLTLLLFWTLAFPPPASAFAPRDASLVWTQLGKRAIEELRAGDMVCGNGVRR